MVTTATWAQDVRTYIPAQAQTLAPVLVSCQRNIWPKAPESWTLAGLVEQESCITLTHSKCWNSKSELKTAREYGFGLGQITITKSFNKFEELKSTYASLRNWFWDDRYNANYQLIAIVEMNLGLWRKWASDPGATLNDQWAFVLSSYNGGASGVMQDRLLCSNTKGCDQSKWFGNVELTSLKSKVPQPAYGNKSWYTINRTYVYNVLMLRRAKYKSFWEQSNGPTCTG
jgi:hypothetical protein